MTAACVMVLGTASGAGKSWLATALCRHYARQGLRVAPFKAQNMSNNARVVAAADGWSEGGEIGSAQYFQALAARCAPEVRMNPVLLKPESDVHSQVVLLGQVDAALSGVAWRERAGSLWPHVCRALDDLRAGNDVVVIEGAGSPAEINLVDCDIVNMRVAVHCSAQCLLVTDIDRGGAFAHLYGTWALLPPTQRHLVRGFVLNKFRGDVALLEPAPRMLQERTGVPTVATLPMWWEHGLPEEDGVMERPSRGAITARHTVAVVAYPRISNLDEFQSLTAVPGLRLIWARDPRDLADADLVVLPGSKHTSSDLAWLRARGLDRAVADHGRLGRPVLGICGGLQMLGEALIDPFGIDGNAPGLGLLPLVTVFSERKTVRRTEFTFLADMPTCAGTYWGALASVSVAGYEIHHGQTSQHVALAQLGDLARPVVRDNLAWINGAGNVLGLVVHGLFENPVVIRALYGSDVQTLDDVFDGLADFIERHFSPGFLSELLVPSTVT